MWAGAAVRAHHPAASTPVSVSPGRAPASQAAVPGGTRVIVAVALVGSTHT